jgi:hypothetical protein
MIMMDKEEAKYIEKQMILREMKQEEIILSTISDDELEFE